jgi:predicted CXXCH cytochrome family protein
MRKGKLLVQIVIFTTMAHLFSASFAASVRSKSVVGGPHDLVAGGGQHGIKVSAVSNAQGRVCIFCHSPHHSGSVTPLWSRPLSVVSYTTYSPTKMTDITILQPRIPSKLCLSCHDGTIALGLLIGSYPLDASLKSLNEMPAEPDSRLNPNLGTDLSDDHPISFIYNASNPELNPDVQDMKLQGVRLDMDQYVECSSCHDPHNNQNGNFLVKNCDTSHDALCTTCHNKAGWNDIDSRHRLGGGGSIATVLSDVKADGCNSCHLPHSAPGHMAIQKGLREEDTCWQSCHQGSPYATNILAEFRMTYKHPVENYDKLHQAKETLPLDAEFRHVECVDCHNPHRAGWSGAPLDSLNPSLSVAKPPNVSGPLQGVCIANCGSSFPTYADYEFQVCFKCHSGGSAELFIANQALLPARQFPTFQEDNRFFSGNSSYHPVTADRPAGNAGKSLKSDYSSLKRIYCTDCHSRHGSTQPHILALPNDATFPASEASRSENDYPLCFKCHDWHYLFDTSVTHSSSLTLHQSHVYDHASKAPCSACHDPHGVPTSRGATSINGAHLINFDTTYTGLNPLYRSDQRSCTVAGSCHTSVAQFQTY